MKFDCRSVLVSCCFVLLSFSPTVVGQTVDAAKPRKVTVTLVRWPYT